MFIRGSGDQRGVGQFWSREGRGLAKDLEERRPSSQGLIEQALC